MIKITLLSLLFLHFAAICLPNKIALNSLQEQFETAPHDVITKIDQHLENKDLDSVLELELMLLKGKSFIELTQLKLASDVFYKVTVKAEEKGLDKLKARALFFYADAKFQIGDYSTAIQGFKKASVLFKKYKMLEMYARSLMSIGNCYSNLGQLENALEYHLMALPLMIENGSLSSISKLYNNIGVVYYWLDQFEMAAEYYKKAINFVRQGGDLLKEASYLANLGEAYTELSESDLARNAFHSALEIAQSLNNTRLRGALSRYIGKLELKEGNDGVALIHFEEAIRIAKLSNSDNWLISSYLGKSRALLKSDTVNSLHFAQLANELAIKIGKLVSIRDSHKLLYDIYLYSKDYENALIHRNEHFIIDNDMLSKQLESDLFSLSNELEVKQKEHEIQLLEKEKELHESTIEHQNFIKYVYAFGLTILFILLFVQYKRSYHKKQSVILKLTIEEQTKNIQKLSNIGLEISSSLRLEEVLELIYQHVSELMLTDVFFIGLYDKSNEVISVEYSIEGGEKKTNFSYFMNEVNYPAVYCVKNNAEVITSSISGLLNYVKEIPHPKAGRLPESLIYLPLLDDKNVIGCLSVQSYQKDSYLGDELNMLRTISYYAANAVINANSHTKLEATFNELQQAHAELKSTQEQLLQSSKMATIGTLTAGIAHEINNPTNFANAAIFMMHEETDKIKKFLTQLAGGDSAKPDVIQAFDEKFSKLQGLIKTASEGTKRIKTIVADLRTFSRLDDAKQAYANITELLDSTIHLVLTQYDSVVIETQYEYQPLLNCFPSKLNQLFMNIIINACQAVSVKQLNDKDFEGRITISTENVNEKLQLLIVDNGCGMDETTRLRVFEPFFTTKGVGEGTGLGMAISFGIIEEHNGTIEVESTLGKGTKVSIRFDA